MSPRWPATTYLKVHEHCGGMVRWVEAYDRPGVGFTGECVECGAGNIPVERILPFELPDGMTVTEAYGEVDQDDLRSFHWDPENHEYDEKQAAFRELIA